MARRSGLGKGLGALIPSEVSGADQDAALREIPVSQIEPNPNQPRGHFDEEALVALTASVTELGVLQPVLVRPLGQDRYELIDGVVVMSPSPLPRHQKLSAFLTAGLVDAARAQPGLEFFPDTDVVFPGDTVYRPDLVVYAPGRLPRVPERLTAVPDLVVEILSPGTKPLDLITKRGDYERFGVAEYWVLDPDALTVRAWRRVGGKFVEETAAGSTVSSSSVEGVVLDLAALRRFMGG